MTKLNCAIVGCGGIAQVHAAALHAQETAQLTAFADIRPERAESLAHTYGGRAYGSLEELLEKERLDVLHICTPHHLHTPMARQALERGIAVFTEKPPVIDETQWEEFQSLAGLGRLGVCFQNRYNQETALLRQLLDSGRPGSLCGARAFVTWRREAPYYTESGWRGALATEGGGALINQSIHTMDLLGEFLGRAERVDAALANHHLKGVIEVEDTFEARIVYPAGSAVFFATTGHCEDSPVLLELVCERAVLRAEGHEVTVTWRQGGKDRYELPEPALTPGGKPYWGASHALCIANFYDSLLTNRPFRNDVAGIRNTAELMLAAYRSAREGREIAL